MLLSKRCVYGIQAALYLAMMEDPQHYVSIRKISDELDISFHFLTKVLQTLTQHNIMVSFKGPNGGIALARPAERITLADIINAIDESKSFNQCLLGFTSCCAEGPCALHDYWAGLREHINDVFIGASIAQIAANAKANHLKIAQLHPVSLADQATETEQATEKDDL